jgi:transposase
MFGVSLASIKRYLKQRRESGDLSPKAIPGRPSKKYAALEAGLVAQLEAYPDSTLEAHCQLWESTHGMWVDHTTMSRAIRRVGWTRKKNRQCNDRVLPPYARVGLRFETVKHPEGGSDAQKETLHKHDQMYFSS